MNLTDKYKKDIDMLKHRMGVRGVTNIRNEIDKRKKHKSQSQSQMKSKISYELIKGGVRFTSGVEYSSYLNRGIKKHLMTYLRKAKSAIPLPEKAGGKFTGETIFRNGSKGDWLHPGNMRFKNFMGTALNKTLNEHVKEIRNLNKRAFKK